MFEENRTIIKEAQFEKLKEDIGSEISKLIVDFLSIKNENIFSMIDPDLFKAKNEISKFLESIPQTIINFLDNDIVLLNDNGTEKLNEFTSLYHYCNNCSREYCVLKGIIHVFIREYYLILKKYDIEDEKLKKCIESEICTPDEMDLSNLKSILNQYAILNDIRERTEKH